MMPESLVYNMDCLEAMRQMPDKAFDLAVVDPPYGDAADTHTHTSGPDYNRFGNPGSRFERYKRDPDRGDLGGEVRKKIIAWDVAPGQEYFDELFRVSRNQIIWGGNYFKLPPTRCFLVWRKLTLSENFTMAMAEYAWTSFNGNAKVFDAMPQGKPGDRFHPTQKPF
jgi:site-specific DNA-methyltransferase (adenine-specific)